MNDFIFNPESDQTKVAHFKATRSARCEWCLIHFKIKIVGDADFDSLENHRNSCKKKNAYKWNDCYQLHELEERKKKHEEEQQEQKKKQAIKKLRRMEQRKRQIEQDRQNAENKRKQDRLNQRMRKDRHYDPYSNNYGAGGQAGLKPRGAGTRGGRGRGQRRGTGRGRGRGRGGGRKMKHRDSGYHGSVLIPNDNNQRLDNIIFIH